MPIDLRAARRLACAILSALPAITASDAAGQAPDYSRYTAARFIPFAAPITPACDLSPFPRECPAQVPVLIGGERRRLTMDTGTTGIMISASLIVGYDPDAAPADARGWEFLSSSKRLWVGHWIHASVAFYDDLRSTVEVSSPVLAVDREAHCPTWKRGDGPRCLASMTASNPDGLSPAGDGILYMGVGFGREDDGQPFGTPGRNPFLNVASFAGVPVGDSLRSGYIITSRGVHLGLTPANTARFAYTRLQPRSDSARDWAAPRICVQVDPHPCRPGTTLLDTGIESMYLSTPDSLRTVRTPNPNEPGDTVTALPPGTPVTVRFGQPRPIAYYTFRVGESINPLQPSVAIRAHDAATFVNTGRHVYWGFDVLYDADGGFFGLRWMGPPDSTQGGVTPSAGN